MSRWNLAWLLGVPALVVVGLTLVFAAPRPPRPKDQDYEMVQLWSRFSRRSIKSTFANSAPNKMQSSSPT